MNEREHQRTAARDDQGSSSGEQRGTTPDRPVQNRRAWSRSEWGALLLILGIAVALRIGFITDIGQRGDFEAYSAWIDNIRGAGLFSFYDPGLRFDIADRTYPALATYSFGALGLLRDAFPATFDDRSHPATYIALLKLFPVGCELATIVVTFFWLRAEPVQARLRYLICGLLALSPALVLINAWWGQFDSPYVLCGVLTLLALNRDRPRAAWITLGASVLLKQLGIVLLPLVLILSWRRYGLRSTALGLGIFAVMIIMLTIPFAVATGPSSAFSPLWGGSSIYPNTTNGAFNLWYIADYFQGVTRFERPLLDSAAMIGPLSPRLIAVGLFGSYTLLLLAIVWRDGHKHQEFVWAAALYCGFFVLMTQIQVRYLYSGAVLTIIAIAQARRMRIMAWGFLATFAYNTIYVLSPEHPFALNLAPETLGIPVSLINIALTALVAWTAFRSSDRPPRIT